MNEFFNNLLDLEKIVLDKQLLVTALQEVHKSVPEKSWTTRWVKSTYRLLNRTEILTIYIGGAAEVPFSIIDLNTNLPLIAVRMSWSIQITVMTNKSYTK